MITENSIQKQPLVARIDYLYKGGVGESVEYTDADEFIRDVKEQNEYGVPMTLVLYADAKGETIPRGFVQEMDPPPQGVAISYENVPVYYESPRYAKEHNESPAFFASHRANEACRKAIDDAIANHYDGQILDSGAYKQVIGCFGHERTMCILANTIRDHDWDARISRENKEWAAGVRIPDYPHMAYNVLLSHPGLVNIFANTVRRRYLMQKPLSDDEIRAEAERILHGFREADKPNSPNGSHYMVKIADDFMTRVRGQQTSRLSRYMPFKSFYLTTIKGQKGLYALIRSNEDRSKPLRTVKPSVRGKLKEPVETPASGQTAKKKERDL